MPANIDIDRCKAYLSNQYNEMAAATDGGAMVWHS